MCEIESDSITSRMLSCPVDSIALFGLEGGGKKLPEEQK